MVHRSDNESANTAARVLFACSIVVSISVWFLAFRAPLWLDETSSYWEIAGGFHQIRAREGILFSAHAYILWAFAKVLGTSEVALRVPEVLAMMGATYLFFRVARELFSLEVAIATTCAFCLHPLIVFAAIDVRPYAFALLSINASILALVRLRDNDSNWLASTFGVLAGSITYFQLLFSILWVPLAICFLLLKKSPRVLLRQVCVATAGFILSLIPVLSRFGLLMHSGRSLSFADRPQLPALITTMAPGWLLLLYPVFLMLAALRRDTPQDSVADWRILCACLLGPLPLLGLYLLSVHTPIQVFVERYRVVAIPGIMLCWGFLFSLLRPFRLRIAFLAALVVVNSAPHFLAPLSDHHGYSWKHALELADRTALRDGATILICSDFPQSDSNPIPSSQKIKDSSLFTQLSYYKVAATVVGLPRGLTSETERLGRQFLQASTERPFILLAYWRSRAVVDWLAQSASATHEVHQLGEFDEISVVEFTPRSRPRDEGQHEVRNLPVH